MSVKDFITKDNINMIWDVIIDEETFRFIDRDNQEKVYQLFLDNVKGFFETERKIKMNNLINMNKKYILLILNYIKNNFSYQPNKIRIHNENIKESITYEEIHNERQNQFEKNYNIKQNEFNELINVTPPPSPEFADKELDKPIKEMDKILREMEKQRNYEIDQINKNYNNSGEVNNWLSPKETSLKRINKEIINEINLTSKNNFNQINVEHNLNNNKYENILVKNKKVTFNNIEEINSIDYENTKLVDLNESYENDNIFLKLKKIPEIPEIPKTSEIPEKENINIEYKKTDYIERIVNIENDVKNIKEKIDLILNYLKK